jgi:hypothetical protein
VEVLVGSMGTATRPGQHWWLAVSLSVAETGTAAAQDNSTVTLAQCKSAFFPQSER